MDIHCTNPLCHPSSNAKEKSYDTPLTAYGHANNIILGLD